MVIQGRIKVGVCVRQGTPSDWGPGSLPQSNHRLGAGMDSRKLRSIGIHSLCQPALPPANSGGPSILLLCQPAVNRLEILQTRFAPSVHQFRARQF